MSASISRPAFARLLALGAALFGASVPASAATEKGHRIAFHVDANDPAIMNLTLNNVTNAKDFYSGNGETLQVEVVAYGPGLHMLRADTSPVKDRLAAIKASMPDVMFSACGVTMAGMARVEGHPIAILPQARVVPGGVVRLTELQEMGWSYIKP